nr:hypothetical protein pKpn33002_00216 [Klebsiella pneumoniae]
MLKNSLMFLVIILLTACQHPPRWHKTLPAINFSPVKTVEMPGKVTGEYSVRVVNAGIDVYIIIDNGYNEFMTVDKLSLYGNRCGYESQGSCSFLPLQSVHIWFLM